MIAHSSEDADGTADFPGIHRFTLFMAVASFGMEGKEAIFWFARGEPLVPEQRALPGKDMGRLACGEPYHPPKCANPD